MKTHCKKQTCSGVLYGPMLNEMGDHGNGPWKENVYTCDSCGESLKILVMINGKTGKAGEKLNKVERDIIGALSYVD